MMKRLLSVTLMVMLLVTLTVTATPRPKFLECMDTEECSVGTCCSVGEGRFSVPQCRAHGIFGDRCRPSHEKPENITLEYPEGTIVNFTNIYRLICPCALHLYCSNETGTCQDYVEDTKFNEIDDIF